MSAPAHAQRAVRLSIERIGDRRPRAAGAPGAHEIEMNFLFALLFSLFIADGALALDVPPLKSLVTDLAGMFPPASLGNLDQPLRRFKTETANDVVGLTVKSLYGEDIAKLTRATIAAMPLDEGQQRPN